VLLALFCVATLASGRAYMWCVAMEQAVSHCCCDGDDQGDGLHEVARAPALKAACCASRAQEDLPATQATPPAIEVPPALAAASEVVEPVLEHPRPTARRVAARAPASTRYGPTRAGPRSAAGRCAALQVFRC